MVLKIVILAAGQGSRMHSEKPKVLQPIAGKPILFHIIETANSIAEQQTIIIYGHNGELLKKEVESYYHNISWAYQAEQLGTAHAVSQALDQIEEDDRVVVLTGDVPFIRKSTLDELNEGAEKDGFSIVTTDLENPFGYGRIKRNKNGNIVKIIEHKDATKEELQITEINTGIMAMPGKFLLENITKIENNNAQSEYYFTDIIELAVAEGLTINSVKPTYSLEVEGINTRNQLAYLEREYQKMKADELMANGLSISDSKRFDLRGNISFGKDVHVDINVIFEGENTLGNNCTIGANCILTNVKLDDGVEVKPMSILENVHVKKNAVIGPFARLRPDTIVEENAKVGNFVEIKKSTIGKGSKVNHLSYIGDAEIGKEVNVGAGTITCNYDGVNKHKTTIQDEAFIGSNTSLVAPVIIEESANIGAGSTISKDAPAKKLTVARAKQIVIDKWKRPEKK